MSCEQHTDVAGGGSRFAKVEAMSYDEDDARQDAYMESLFEEFFRVHGPEIEGEAVARFQDERFQSHFRGNPALIEPARRRLVQAVALLETAFHDAALVFAVSATEVALKYAILIPTVHGFVQSEAAAKIIAEVTFSGTGVVRYRNLFLDVLSELVGANMREFKRPDSAKTLWTEIAESNEHRNKIVHGGEERTREHAPSLPR